MENISDLRLFNHSEVLCYGPRFSSSNDFNRACILIGVKKNIVPLLGRYSIGIQVAFISIGQPTFNISQLPFIVSMPAMKNPTPSAAMPIPVHCSQQGRVGIPHQMLAISTAGMLIYIIQLEYQGLASLIFLQSVGPSLHYLSRCLLASHHLLVCKPWHICLLMVSDR